VPTLISRLIAYVFVGIVYAVGPLFLIIAIGLSIPTARFVSDAIATDGTVIDIQPVYIPRRSRYFYLPVFRFIASDGQTHMLRAESSVSLVRFKRGDSIRVLYLKDHPETARIDTIPQLWMPELILASLGVIFTALAVRIHLRKRSLRQML
jgi:hypothetical protein